MINSYNVNQYCCEDIRLIENYDKAVNDPEIYDCHHRRETDLGLSRDELVEQGLYFNVPAADLIFLTKAEHSKVHHDGENSPMYGRRGEDSPNYGSKRSEDSKQKMRDNHYDCSGENNPMYGKNCEDYMSEEAIKEKRKKQSKTMEKRPWMNNGAVRVRPKTQEEIEHYLERGYVFGKKLK